MTAKFDGHLSTEEGQASAEAFSEKLEIPRDVIFDVRKMQGYESGARRAWQQTLWPLRDHILSLTVVGGNALVRMGATVLGTFLGLSVTFTDETE